MGLVGAWPVEITAAAVFHVFYALAIGSPRGMQTEQQGRTDAVPAARYTLSRAVILKLPVQVANPEPVEPFPQSPRLVWSHLPPGAL